MGIHGQRRLAEGDVEDDVGGLAADAGQGLERLAVARHMAAVAVDDLLRQGDDVPGLGVVEADGLDVVLQAVEAEGDLFPHSDECECSCDEEPPPPEPLFQFSFLINKTGNTDLVLCDEIVPVEIDIKEGSINLKKKGVLPVVLLRSDDFDPQDVDPDTVKLGGVLAEKYSVNGKGDVTFHFSVPDLVASGFLTKDTTSLTLTGSFYEDLGDVCIKGSDTVTITPNNK